MSPSLFVQPFLLPKPTFDYAALKAAFRARARELDIDPEHGSSVYQAANVQAMTRKREFARQQGEKVREHVVLVEAGKRVAYTDSAPGFDDGRGSIDPAKVNRMASRRWWADSYLWIQGRPTLASLAVNAKKYDVDMHGRTLKPTEVEAILTVRMQAVEEEQRMYIERRYNAAFRITVHREKRRVLTLAA